MAENKLIVVDEIRFDEIKTKNFQNMLNALHVQKAFVLLDENDKNTVLSARNIQDVRRLR